MANTTLVSVKTPWGTSYVALTIENLDEPETSEYISCAYEMVKQMYPEGRVSYEYRNQWTDKSFKVRVQGPEVDLNFIAEVTFVQWDVIPMTVSF